MSLLNTIRIRGAGAADGPEMWRVVTNAGNLDVNSSYLYMLLARDFAGTCVVAESAGRLMGFVSGYRRPAQPEVLFLWQVALLPETQGQGLGKRLVYTFLQQPGAAGAARLETTVGANNDVSRGLFRSIARSLGADCVVHACFASADFPEPGHEPEDLFVIGPLDQDRIAAFTDL